MTRSAQIASVVQALLAEGASPAEIGRAIAAYLELSPRAANKERRIGSRLPSDWRPSEACIAYARHRKLSSAQIAAEAEKFRNYWTAKSGASAAKRDWSATWRNWIINSTERGYGPPSYQGQRPRAYSTTRRPATGSDAVIAGMARLARRLDERRISEVEVGRPLSNHLRAAGELDL